MSQLRVEARIHGGITLPYGTLALDGLLAYAVALRMGYGPLGFRDPVPIEIPIALEPGGRFHLASHSLATFDAHESRFVNRRYPLAEAQMLGHDKLRRVHLAAGPTKSYRIPTTVAFAHGDEIAWACIGDADPIRELLASITHLGGRRAVGRGRVAQWRVTPTKSWGPGFPVVRDGRPLRPLPADWPGLSGPRLAYASMTYPYWDRTREELCAVPC